jgi:hypothetical protein
MMNTAHDFENFEKSSIWKDILEELNLWLDEIHKSSENPEAEARALFQMQGNAEAIRKVMMLPGEVAINLRQDQKEKRDE